MILDLFPNSTAAAHDQLKELAMLIENYPIGNTRHLFATRGVQSYDRPQFDALFDALYDQYSNGIDALGLDALLEKNRHLEFVSVIDREAPGFRDRVIHSAILYDLWSYFYSVDDFISLPKDSYLV